MLRNLILLLLCVGLVACAGTEVQQKHPVMAEEVVISVTKEPQIAIPAAAKFVKISDVVMFDFDSSVIREDADAILDGVAKLMSEFPQTVLSLNGFASKEGPIDYNVTLSQARANAVKEALIAKGVPAESIASSIGLGATIDFGDILKLNRRVMILSIN